MADVYTVNPKGEKTVHVRATKNEKNRFTVVLTIAAGIHFFFLFFFNFNFLFLSTFSSFSIFYGLTIYLTFNFITLL
jgi:hypothetical protein